MSDHDLQIETDHGRVIVTVTPLAGENADAVADDVAAIIGAEYEDVKET